MIWYDIQADAIWLSYEKSNRFSTVYRSFWPSTLDILHFFQPSHSILLIHAREAFLTFSLSELGNSMGNREKQNPTRRGRDGGGVSFSLPGLNASIRRVVGMGRPIVHRLFPPSLIDPSLSSNHTPSIGMVHSFRFVQVLQLYCMLHHTSPSPSQGQKMNSIHDILFSKDLMIEMMMMIATTTPAISHDHLLSFPALSLITDGTEELSPDSLSSGAYRLKSVCRRLYHYTAVTKNG